MDIRDKLRQIESLQIKRVSAGPEFRPPAAATSFPNSEVETILGGAQKLTPFGSFFCREKDCAPEYQHGNVAISLLLQKAASSLAVITHDSIFSKTDLRRVLFLDTETTGMSGGTGMFAFLVGVGFFTESGFKVQQFFLDDIKNESAMLHALNDLLEDHQTIVTYNGKSFDAPLLETRYICHRLLSPLADLPHLDLVHCARRIWKRWLADCALTTIEREVLKHQRTGDIPSYLIPHIYFDYVHDRDPRPLKPVFYHNQQDVLAMAAILGRLMHLVENPFEADNPLETFALARNYENLIEFERANEIYARLLPEKLPGSVRREALVRTAFNYKRLGKWSDAAETWGAFLAAESFHPLPYLELAKHYEHRDRDLAKAKNFVEKALAELSIAEGVRRRSDWLVYKEDLEYRRKRLVRKLAAARQRTAPTPPPDWTSVE